MTHKKRGTAARRIKTNGGFLWSARQIYARGIATVPVLTPGNVWIVTCRVNPLRSCGILAFGDMVLSDNWPATVDWSRGQIMYPG